MILHGANSNQQQKKTHKLLNLEENHIKHKIEIKYGEPAQTVINEANRQHEIIVLGTRGLNNFQEMMMGSVL